MNRLGVWSASALCVIGMTYVVALAVGFASAGFDKPIVDPLLAVMETLTLLSAPILVVLMAAVHAYAPPEYKIPVVANVQPKATADALMVPKVVR